MLSAAAVPTVTRSEATVSASFFINVFIRCRILSGSALHDFLPQDFMHILYSDLQVGPA
jgi:hypothetical protein